MFQAGMMMITRNELASLTRSFLVIIIIILILHLSVRDRVRAGGHGKPFDPS